MVVKRNLMTQLERRKICDKLHLFFVHGNIFYGQNFVCTLFYLSSGVYFFDEKEKWKAYNPIYG